MKTGKKNRQDLTDPAYRLKLDMGCDIMENIPIAQVQCYNFDPALEDGDDILCSRNNYVENAPIVKLHERPFDIEWITSIWEID